MQKPLAVMLRVFLWERRIRFCAGWQSGDWLFRQTREHCANSRASIEFTATCGKSNQLIITPLELLLDSYPPDKRM